tara:strand:+ start:183 stop:1286 length:1104 start_codon:yes stop_codon:yes gene_type:complete
MRPVAIRKLAPAVPIVAGAVTGGAATGAASTTAAATAGTGIGSALMQGAKKKIGQVGVKDAASIAQDATDKHAERAQQAQQNNIQSSQNMADKAKEEAKVKTGEPMDIALRLLKMPLVPNSIKQIATYNDGGPDPIDDYTAEYKHPETGEIYPMFGTVRPDLGRGGGSEVRIGGKGNAHDTGFNYDENRYANEMYRDDGHWDGKTITPRYASLREASLTPLSADVHTAMNDLAASMYDKYGVKVIPPTYGESMMETGYKPKTDLEEEIWADKEHWPVPVQTGEPMDIAMQMLKGSVHLTHNEDLPHQFAQDITNLDHNHQIMPTETGSSINHIHPDMLRTIELMAQNYQENSEEEQKEPFVMPKLFV